jgi:hypothetical protein
VFHGSCRHHDIANDHLINQSSSTTGANDQFPVSISIQQVLSVNGELGFPVSAAVTFGCDSRAIGSLPTLSSNLNPNEVTLQKKSTRSELESR